MIEERRTRLDRVRHRHAIDLGENVRAAGTCGDPDTAGSRPNRCLARDNSAKRPRDRTASSPRTPRPETGWGVHRRGPGWRHRDTAGIQRVPNGEETCARGRLPASQRRQRSSAAGSSVAHGRSGARGPRRRTCRSPQNNSSPPSPVSTTLTCVAASFETTYVAMADVSPNGSSRYQTRSSTFGMTLGSRTIS
jgi:hypothetical protein